MQKKNNVRIGEMLSAKGVLSSGQIQAVLNEQRENGGLFGEISQRMGFVKELPVTEVLAEQFGLGVMDPMDLKISKTIIDKMPARMARHYRAFPVAFEKNELFVAMQAPPGAEVMQELSAVLGRAVKVVLGPKASIDEAIDKFYGLGAVVVEQMVKARPASDEEFQTGWDKGGVEETNDSAGESSVRELVNQLLTDAWTKRATDIHMEPFPGELVVRYRIDGVLCDAKVSPDTKRFYRNIISRIKIMANLDISEQRRPQDGRLKVRFSTQEIDMRISLLPTAFGEAIVIRILSSAQLLSMDSVGLSPGHMAKLKKVILKPHGMVLLTGPTGSGKTTTLYSCLHALNQEERKIITVEDPVEYILRGIVQMQIHPKIGLTFAAGLKHMLRHDPDVMMVGEIRDSETAEIAVRSALTGHLVFSTLHTNDASSAIARLLDLDIPSYLVSSSLIAVIAQRLVRLICPHCRTEKPLDQYSGDDFSELLKTRFTDRKFYHGAGCGQCRGTGYQGRMAIHEVMTVDEEMRELISNRASVSAIKKHAILTGMELLQMDGLEKAAQGLTTIQEVFRVTR